MQQLIMFEDYVDYYTHKEEDYFTYLAIDQANDWLKLMCDKTQIKIINTKLIADNDNTIIMFLYDVNCHATEIITVYKLINRKKQEYIGDENEHI